MTVENWAAEPTSGSDHTTFTAGNSSHPTVGLRFATGGASAASLVRSIDGTRVDFNSEGVKVRREYTNADVIEYSDVTFDSDQRTMTFTTRIHY